MALGHRGQQTALNTLGGRICGAVGGIVGQGAGTSASVGITC